MQSKSDDDEDGDEDVDDATAAKVSAIRTQYAKIVWQYEYDGVACQVLTPAALSVC